MEHDTLTLLLDLILLKRDVYRHLLYNRGLGARKVGGKANVKNEGERSTQRHHDPTVRVVQISLFRLALAQTSFPGPLVAHR